MVGDAYNLAVLTDFARALIGITEENDDFDEDEAEAVDEEDNNPMIGVLYSEVHHDIAVAWSTLLRSFLAVELNRKMDFGVSGSKKTTPVGISCISRVTFADVSSCRRPP